MVTEKENDRIGSGEKVATAGGTMEENEDVESEDGDEVVITEKNAGGTYTQGLGGEAGEGQFADVIGGIPNNEGLLGDMERIALGKDVGEGMEEIRDEQRENVAELEERER